MRHRYLMIDGELVEVTRDYVQEPRANGLLVIPDIDRYQSMVDGSVIDGRKQHREHLRAHRLIEVGNETKHLMRPREYKAPPGVKETLIREVHRAQEAQRHGRKYD